MPEPVEEFLSDGEKELVKTFLGLVREHPYPAKGTRLECLEWALRVTPKLVDTNLGLHGMTKERDKWLYPASVKQYVSLVAQSLTAGAEQIRSQSSLDGLCPKECPAGLARWIIELREYLRCGTSFDAFSREPSCDDPELTAGDCLEILLSPVRAAIELGPAPQEDNNPQAASQSQSGNPEDNGRGAPKEPDPPAGAAKGDSPLDPELAAKEAGVSDIPPLDVESPEWTRAKGAAKREGLGVRTLADYRKPNLARWTSPDRMSGVDRDGRKWRRPGTKRSHPWYHVPSLKNSSAQ